MNEEYEYSFKVDNIDKYIDYCKNNGYELIEDYNQIRKIYKNNSNIMARITENISLNNKFELLSFKEDIINDNVLNIRKESLDLVINDDNRKFVNSLLKLFEYNEFITLVRKRYVYKKDDVIFEIDDYENPLMKVISIEGVKDSVDKVYNDINNINN